MFKKQKRKRKIGYSGNFSSWQRAEDESSGYDSKPILEKVLIATRSVIAGNAAYEQDSITFPVPSCPSYLLAALAISNNVNNERIDILDWGGSLGSLYFRSRPYWPIDAKNRWHVVEQNHFVEIGRKEINQPHLAFHEEVPKCNFTLAILSSVLQYISAPHEVLQNILSFNPAVVLIARTAFMQRAGLERISVQEVFQPIYEASYPCRFSDEAKINS